MLFINRLPLLSIMMALEVLLVKFVILIAINLFCFDLNVEGRDVIAVVIIKATCFVTSFCIKVEAKGVIKGIIL